MLGALLALTLLGMLVLRELRRRDRDLERQRALTREVQATLESAQKNGLLASLLAGVAHDLRGLLQIIQVSLEPLAESASDFERQRIDAIDRACRKASKLVAQTVQFGRGSPKEKRFQLEELVASYGHLYSSAMTPGMKLVVEIEQDQESEGYPVYGTESAMEQVILNLLTNASNAIAETEGGNIWLRLGSGRSVSWPVDARTERCSSCHEEVTLAQPIRLVCEDSGPGISEDVIGRVFERFFTTRAELGGSGIGLAAVAESVHGMGGHLYCENRPEGGARFVVLLPRSLEESASPEAAVPEAVAG